MIWYEDDEEAERLFRRAQRNNGILLALAFTIFVCYILLMIRGLK